MPVCFWDHETDIKRFRRDSLLYWDGTPEQQRQVIYQYRNKR